MAQNDTTEPDQGYGELTHVEAENEYGILFPDGREEFSVYAIRTYGVDAKDLGTLEGQGKARDGYARTLKLHGIPESLGLRLRFAKRKRIVSITKTVDLNTED